MKKLKHFILLTVLLFMPVISAIATQLPDGMMTKPQTIGFVILVSMAGALQTMMNKGDA